MCAINLSYIFQMVVKKIKYLLLLAVLGVIAAILVWVALSTGSTRSETAEETATSKIAGTAVYAVTPEETLWESAQNALPTFQDGATSTGMYHTYLAKKLPQICENISEEFDLEDADRARFAEQLTQNVTIERYDIWLYVTIYDGVEQETLTLDWDSVCNMLLTQIDRELDQAPMRQYGYRAQREETNLVTEEQIEDALPQESTFSKRTLVKVALAGLLPCLLFGAFIVVRAALNGTVKGKADMEQNTDLYVLASVREGDPAQQAQTFSCLASTFLMRDPKLKNDRVILMPVSSEDQRASQIAESLRQALGALKSTVQVETASSPLQDDAAIRAVGEGTIVLVVEQYKTEYRALEKVAKLFAHLEIDLGGAVLVEGA